MNVETRSIELTVEDWQLVANAIYDSLVYGCENAELRRILDVIEGQADPKQTDAG